MKLIPKASLAFKKEKPATKVSFGANVINCLLAASPVAKNVQSLFPDLPVTVAELQAFNDDVAAAVADALTGAHSAVAGVKPAIDAWNNAFTVTAKYVSSVAAGSEVTIRLGGFIPTKSESSPKQKPGVSAEFNATINGSKGAIVAGSKKAVEGAIAYFFSAVPNGVDVSYSGNTIVFTLGEQSIFVTVDTRKQTEIYNLPSHVAYNVSMVAVNSAGTGPATASQQVTPQ